MGFRPGGNGSTGTASCCRFKPHVRLFWLSAVFDLTKNVYFQVIFHKDKNGLKSTHIYIVAQCSVWRFSIFSDYDA